MKRLLLATLLTASLSVHAFAPIQHKDDTVAVNLQSAAYAYVPDMMSMRASGCIDVVSNHSLSIINDSDRAKIYRYIFKLTVQQDEKRGGDMIKQEVNDFTLQPGETKTLGGSLMVRACSFREKEWGGYTIAETALQNGEEKYARKDGYYIISKGN